MKNNLPNKMSALIKIALEDLRKVERSKKFRVNMLHWVRPDSEDPNICEVCLAGAVLVKRLGADPRHRLYITNLATDLTNKLHALNRLRLGCVLPAAESLGMSVEKKNKLVSLSLHYVRIVSYEENPRLFRRGMKKLAEELEKYGF